MLLFGREGVRAQMKSDFGSTESNGGYWPFQFTASSVAVQRTLTYNVWLVQSSS
jgi:hypothetical protein